MINEEIVTKEWRQNAPYKMVGQFKVADLDKIADEIVADRRKKGQSMFINFAALKADKFKELHNMLRFCADPETGILYGMQNGLMPDGNIRWRAVIMEEMHSLNLNFKNDQLEYAFIRMHPKVVGSPFQVGDPVYRIIDEDKIAAVKGLKFRTMEQALRIANKMKKEEMLPFGRYLGIGYQVDASANIIRTTLLEYAANDPIDFMEKYNNSQRKLLELFRNAIVVGIIKHDYDKGYKYKAQALGFGEAEVIAKMINDATLCQSIQGEVIKQDQTMKNLVKEGEKTSIFEQPEDADKLISFDKGAEQKDPDEYSNEL